MRITKYITKINQETLRTELVKEKAVNYPACKKLNNPQLIVAAMNQLFDLKDMSEEYLYMLTFNHVFDLTGVFEIGHGTATSCMASPREIFNKALLVGAICIILVHNHPSGNTTASQEDILLTKRIKEGSRLLDISFLDHIIIGASGYYSFNMDGKL